ncbi:hypothetical protein D9757_005903 [Collybiopsis confluens]|uniref:Cytosol aminopeptidase domain-containing protein n=1 Tax=Collybiopsis confluens TaxID=2823264 RepID=A0A8H5MAG8_9AGAR|nr:hypothetical protein D9757_005903 [Collybiopsis confluens]
MSKSSSEMKNTFLSVTHGTDEPAKFLEIIIAIFSHYKGAPQKDAQPVALVGKGITFDSGGISLKPGENMKLMRGDMGGAGAVVSATLAIAKLKLPVNVVTITPLTENMPGPSATKPGDIIYAMNGKSVEVDNTDAEGRLVLSGTSAAAAGCNSSWADKALKMPFIMPRLNTNLILSSMLQLLLGRTGVLDHELKLTLVHRAMVIALGELYTGVFSTSDELWQRLNVAGEHEFDRFWRMPLNEDYGMCSTGGRPAGSATAALFLKAFAHGIEAEDGSNAATAMKWAHLDIAGAMDSTRPLPYQEKGMTGRPTRALIEYVRGLAN